jgi:hypothetical protein
MIIDHSDNTEKMFLDKDYFYKKKFLPIENFEVLQARNSIASIKKRALKTNPTYSINELMTA